MPNSRGRLLARGPRRLNEWAEGPRNNTIQTITAAGKVLWDIGQEALIAQTIVRIRGEMTAWLPLVTTIGDGYVQVGAAIGIVSADALAVGETAVPGPISDLDWS